MAKVARRALEGLLLVAVLVPLWSSYLVKVYAWQTILSADGVLNWLLDPLGPPARVRQRRRLAGR